MKTQIATALCLAALCAGVQAQALLVANQGNATVSILDPNTGSQIAVVEENTPGVHGHEIVASRDGRTAFLPIYGSTGVGRPGIDGHEMLIIDVPSHKITGHVDFDHGVRPHQPVLDAAHNLLYVTTELDNAVTIVDPRTDKIIGKVPTGQPESHMFVLSHDGRRGYTANVGPGTVSALDLVGRKTIAIIPVSHEVQRISISNDDRYVFTSDQTAPRLAVIDTATNKVMRWVDLPGKGYGTAPTPDGRWLLVCVPSASAVAVVDLKTMKVARTLKVPRTPQEILIQPDGAVAYVSCNASGKVAAIDLANWTVARTFPAGPGADGLAWAK
ncbi:MAG TPA: cytochrome D1 domain-containing protein [Candidatus Aquilonibacter sp.]|nr:cytochrome D1 domain-containing protein [Candidatus Aquilonibacter sp.]